MLLSPVKSASLALTLWLLWPSAPCKIGPEYSELCQSKYRWGFLHTPERNSGAMGLFSSQLSTKTMVPLCRQLATTYDAGIPILQSLQVVGDEFKDRKVRIVLRQMADDIRHGQSLAEATHAQARHLPPIFRYLLATGEHGGRLDVMLKDLADYYEDSLRMRREIVRSMTYPALLLVVAWFLGSFSLGLMKGLTGIFASRNPQFSVGDYFQEYLQLQAVSLAGAAVAFVIVVLLSRLGLFKWIRGLVTTYLWPLSRVTRKFALARFFRSLSLLIGSGVGITECIRNAADVMVNPYIAKDMLRAIPYIKKGLTLDEAFSHCRHLTPMAREMIRVGELSGDLDTSLHKVSQNHFEEATHAVHVAAKVAEVVVFLAVASVIGYIVISFWSGLYGGMLDGLGV